MNLRQSLSGLAVLTALTCTATESAQNSDGLAAGSFPPRIPPQGAAGVFSPADLGQLGIPAESLAPRSGFGAFGGSFPVLRYSGMVETQTQHPEFVVSDRLRPRVDFWVEVFTTTSLVEIVHHRRYPWVEFARLDFSEARANLNDAQFSAYRQRTVDAKLAEIRNAIWKLAHGKEPASAAEQHVAAVFAKLPDPQQELRDAAQYRKMVRSQRGIGELFSAAIERSGPYWEEMKGIFSGEFGLPEDLLFLQYIESGGNDHAGSHVGAAGRWQFMRETARLFGLRVTSAVDERRDPIKATRAAARYLSDAYAELGSWPLAVTSYNHGKEGVRKAARLAGSSSIEDIIDYSGQHRDKLPSFGFAGSNFFAELLAAKEVVAMSHLHFPGVRPDRPHVFTVHTLSKPASIKTLSKTLGVVADSTLMSLNPAVNRKVWAGSLSLPAGFDVRIPHGNVQPSAETTPDVRSTGSE